MCNKQIESTHLCAVGFHLEFLGSPPPADVSIGKLVGYCCSDAFYRPDHRPTVSEHGRQRITL